MSQRTTHEVRVLAVFLLIVGGLVAGALSIFGDASNVSPPQPSPRPATANRTPEELLATIETRRKSPDAGVVKEFAVFLDALTAKCDESRMRIADLITRTMEVLKDEYNIERKPSEIAKWLNAALPRAASGKVDCADLLAIYATSERQARYGE